MKVNIIGDSLTLEQCEKLFKIGFVIAVNDGKITVEEPK